MSGTAPSSWSRLLPVALLVACSLAVYGTTFDHQFLVNWDDTVYVTENETVRGFSLLHLRQAFSRFYLGNYAPLQMVSYMLDYELWGMKAGGFLLTNVLLHTASGVAFYFLLLRLHATWRWALPAALLFLAHPVQVESVAWISQRKNVLAMFFFLLAFLAYLRGRERAGQGSWRWYGASLAAFLLALLAKSVAVVLPLVLLLYELLLREREARQRTLARLLPYGAVAAGAAALAWISQDPAVGGGRADYWAGSLGNTLLTMVPVTARYLGMVLWPASLSPAYAQPLKDGVDLAVLLSFLLLAGIGGVGWWLYRVNRPLCFWLAVFFAGLLPVSQIVPLVTLMNDRYLYFPLLGAAGLFGGLTALAAERLRGVARVTALAGVGAILLVLPALAHVKAEAWENTLTLWQDAIRNEPAASLAWLGLGHAYYYRGYTDRALDALLRSYQLFPQDEDTLLLLGAVHQRRREPLLGRRYLLELATQNPRNATGLLALGENLWSTGELAGAERAYRQALTLRPGTADIQENLGCVLAEDGRLDEAAVLFRQSLAAGGDPRRLQYRLAGVAARAGRTGEALQLLEAALRSGFHGFQALREDAAFAALRSHPEFQRLLQTYGGE